MRQAVFGVFFPLNTFYWHYWFPHLFALLLCCIICIIFLDKCHFAFLTACFLGCVLRAGIPLSKTLIFNFLSDKAENCPYINSWLNRSTHTYENSLLPRLQFWTIKPDFALVIYCGVFTKYAFCLAWRIVYLSVRYVITVMKQNTVPLMAA